MERYAADCPGLRYIRLPEKGGVDQDFCKAVEYARGEYCWLFPDDDLFKPGAVQRVLNELRNGHSLVIVNADVMDRDFSTLLQPSMLDNREDETYGPDDLEGLFLRIVPSISFIGCVVIRRETWLEREHDRYFGTEFIHVGVIFQGPLPGGVFAHFLFNTLNSISTLVLLKQTEQANAMLSRLSSLLRFTLINKVEAKVH